MKKWIALILIVALLLPACSLAADYYIIPDSDTRLLSEHELWDWDYESLGYILNEIFARHGFNFEAANTTTILTRRNGINRMQILTTRRPVTHSFQRSSGKTRQWSRKYESRRRT